MVCPLTLNGGRAEKSEQEDSSEAPRCQLCFPCVRGEEPGILWLDPL